jgi:predicted O-methyltransferase YrrM
MVMKLFRKMPGYRGMRDFVRRHYHGLWLNPFIRFAPPGHFYSPLPDEKFVHAHQEKLFDRRVREIPGIEINEAGQLALVNALSAYYAEMPFTGKNEGKLRYSFANSFFCHGDAIMLYSMLRHLRPRRVVEVGSGFSSAVMLDTSDLFLAGEVEFTFIEPYPQRLFSLLGDQDRVRHRVVQDIVQNVDIGTFTSLDAGDFLFIDSSHVAKIGSDVVHLLTNILPRLKDGVVIHIHDIFWPFEYPESWLREGRAWNENYMLKAFLQFNASFRILLFNSYLGIHHRPAMERCLPLFMQNMGGSLWMEKRSPEHSLRS